MKATVHLHVFQHETDKKYDGVAQVVFLEGTYKNLSFEVLEPNNLEKFVLTISKSGKEVVRHEGAINSHQQIKSYSETQLAIFTLLFGLIIDGVKEAQRTYNGTTGKQSIRERVQEAITLIGKEPVASISLSRDFTWKEADQDMFNHLRISLAR